MKFRKKPVVIEAHQWFKNGDHPEDEAWQHGAYLQQEGKIVRYFRRPDVGGDSICSECRIAFRHHGWIDTLEDGHRVCPGDWVITGVKGERYPCKPDIFDQTYEAVEITELV